MKTFSEEDLKTLAALNERGEVGNERVGAMMFYLHRHGIRFWDGPAGISFPLHGYLIFHPTSLSNVVRQFEHVLRLTGKAV